MHDFIAYALMAGIAIACLPLMFDIGRDIAADFKYRGPFK